MTARDGFLDAALARVRSAARAFCAFVAEQDEIQQRLILINRPWDEEFLHWSSCPGDNGTTGTVLHGHLVPPGRRSTGVTRQGWCPCGARAAGRARQAAGGDQPAERP